MPTNSEGEYRAQTIADRRSTDPTKIIERSDKGLVMKFFLDRVIKDYQPLPEHPQISLAEQTRRLSGEIEAYLRFNSLNCPFVPKLLEASVERRYFAVARIPGHSVFDLLEKGRLGKLRSCVLDQVDQMNRWLRANGFGCMGNNIKDLIVDTDGKVWLIDFETYSAEAGDVDKADIYEPIIYDVIERILVRRRRKAELKCQFLGFAVALFLKRPAKTVKLTAICLVCALCRSLLVLKNENRMFKRR